MQVEPESREPVCRRPGRWPEAVAPALPDSASTRRNQPRSTHRQPARSNLSGVGSPKEGIMLMRFVLAIVTAFAGCVLVGTGVAAGATEVDHFTDGPFPDEVCGVTGTTTVR